MIPEMPPVLRLFLLPVSFASPIPGHGPALRRSLGFETAQSWAIRAPPRPPVCGHLCSRPHHQVLPERSPLHPLISAEQGLLPPQCLTSMLPPPSVPGELHSHGLTLCLASCQDRIDGDPSKANTTPPTQTALLSPKPINPGAPGCSTGTLNSTCPNPKPHLPLPDLLPFPDLCLGY